MYRDWVKILGVLLIKPTQTSMSLPSRLQNCTSKKVLWVQESITISRNRWKGVFFLINCYHDQCMYQWQLLCDNIINANFMYQLYTIIWYFFSSHLEIKIRQTSASVAMQQRRSCYSTNDVIIWRCRITVNLLYLACIF